MFETTRQDVRFASRTLLRNPSFALTGTLVLALGIGAVAAIFSAANSYFFRPLPFADPDGLVRLYETNPEFNWEFADAAPANVLDWREQVDAFEDVAMYSSFVDRVTYVRDGEAVLLSASSVTGNFFSVLGVQAALGRTFRWEETWAGRDDGVVLSHDLWVSEFGSDPGIVGRMLPLGSSEIEVLGVMPPGFRFPTEGTQLWYPWGWDPADRTAVWFRRAHWVKPVARLASGVTVDEANAEFQVVVERLQREYPATNRVMGAGMMPVRDFMVREVRTPLFILFGAVGLLLLLACANVANLMLVRSTDRAREVALRYALGAGRGRVVRMMITESLLLALVGGAVGLGLGWLGIKTMSGLNSVGIDGATTLTLDFRVVAFTLLAAGLSGVLFGVLPALRATNGSVGDSLRDGGRGASHGRGGARTVGTLVAVEVALALVLVVGAGLMVRSALMLRDVDPGFRTEGVLALQFSVPSVRYPARDDVLAFWDRYTELLEGQPGVLRAGTVGQLPLNGTSWSSQFQAEGWPPERVGLDIVHRRADTGYFEALDIPLVRGRLFEPSDGSDDPLVVVINETFAREHFPGEDPIGQKIAYDREATAESIWYEIIGIVGDQHQESPGLSARAEVFENRDQDWGRTQWVVVKTALDPLAIVPSARTALREMDPLIPMGQIRPLREVWSRSMASQTFILALLGVFGATALLLAAVGVYSVAAQAARRRSHEIGIRMALGAASSDVLSLILKRGLLVVGLGLAAGLAIAAVATRALESQLYAVDPFDPGTLTAVVVLLGGVALLASYLPARGATRKDPVDSLRAE